VFYVCAIVGQKKQIQRASQHQKITVEAKLVQMVVAQFIDVGASSAASTFGGTPRPGQRLGVKLSTDRFGQRTSRVSMCRLELE